MKENYINCKTQIAFLGSSVNQQISWLFRNLEAQIKTKPFILGLKVDPGPINNTKL